MNNILLKSGEDINSAQEEFNAVAKSLKKDKKTNKKDMDNSNNDSKKVYLVGVLCLLIGFGVGYLVFADKSDSGELENDDSDTTDVTDATKDDSALGSATTVVVDPIVVTSTSITVEDQNFGDSVIIKSLNLGITAWVVVYEDNAGVPGSILGAHIYDAGEIANAPIALLRGTNADSVYYVKVQGDDGDRVFDYKKDVPVVDGSGKEIMSTFRTWSGTPR